MHRLSCRDCAQTSYSRLAEFSASFTMALTMPLKMNKCADIIANQLRYDLFVVAITGRTIHFCF